MRQMRGGLERLGHRPHHWHLILSNTSTVIPGRLQKDSVALRRDGDEPIFCYFMLPFVLCHSASGVSPSPGTLRLWEMTFCSPAKDSKDDLLCSDLCLEMWVPNSLLELKQLKQPSRPFLSESRI